MDLYAVEIADGARYLRRIRNLSGSGLLLEDRLTPRRPGAILELELPRQANPPLMVQAQVVRLTRGGQVGLRTVDGQKLHDLGGSVDL